MNKKIGITTAQNLDRTWRWQLHVPKGGQQDYMKGIAITEAKAEAAANMARRRYEQEDSN